MELIYETTVTGVGEKAMEFLDQGMFIIFRDDAPEDLKEFAIIHKENNLLREIEKNNTLKMGNKEFKIRCVGSSVNKNMKELGHITFRFDEEEECLPGSINLEKKHIPEIKIGMQIEIWG
ncbi:PTS glucitol/sorbitol transporter subunit IIA [Anaeromicrobium sediminis]|uniref:PTS sorbitol transporter subunit IIA n=1 Tax=Anaeromicrobium sediminis TaxID=1478221 RepID=A0A267MN92_9FIRM|nr:PTS glucitol/sorbitol transporter subunit IIA [Anaeromicrobium sediminis]PAB60220.1 hypothetical protein CCE28_04795 [Anaeromicrobium sediminis]